jgi:hypothetical protein
MATRNALRARQQAIGVDGGPDWMLSIAAANAELLASPTDNSQSSVAAGDVLRRRLHATVADARAADVSWGDIGTALGVPRGNAYQRFRHGMPRGAGAA